VETSSLQHPTPIAALAADGDTTLLATLLLFGGVAAFAFAAVSRLTEVPYGRVLRAIRADELVTRSVGKSGFTYKMQAREAIAPNSERTADVASARNTARVRITYGCRR
jgi:ABC-type branched-subunit amino acid transport system permease subunit